MPAARWAAQLGRGLGLLAGSWYALSRPAVQRADVRIGDALRRYSRPTVDRAVTVTTDLGSVYAVVGAAAVLGAARRRDDAADVLALGAATWTIAQAGKTRVRRERPFDAEGVRRLIRIPTGSSFPSGHAAVGMATTSLLAERARGPRSRALLYGVGSYVAASRVYVGVHYPTDVIGGAGAGLALAALWRGRIARVGRLAVKLALVICRPIIGVPSPPGRRWPSAAQPDGGVRSRPTRPCAGAPPPRCAG